jgi:hypothetical protein
MMEYDHLLGNASEISFPLQRIATNESLLGSKSLIKDIPVTTEGQLTVRHGDLTLQLLGSYKRVVIHS